MNKIFGMLGMATKAGKLLSGEFSVEKAIKQRKVKLVIVAGDASDNKKKLFLDKCKYYNVKILIYSDKKSLGNAIGKNSRASIGINDENFAISIEKLIEENS